MVKVSYREYVPLPFANGPLNEKSSCLVAGRTLASPPVGRVRYSRSVRAALWPGSQVADFRRRWMESEVVPKRKGFFYPMYLSANR